MPELPDLEVFRENIYSRITSKRLTGVEVFKPTRVRSPKGGRIDSLIGRDLLAIGRSGKELLFDFGEHVVEVGIGFSCVGGYFSYSSSSGLLATPSTIFVTNAFNSAAF